MGSRHRRPLRMACLLSAGVFVLAGPQARAEDLAQVFGLARAHDAGLLAAQALLRSAQPRAAQADALLRPALNATGSSSWTRTDPSASGLDPTGERVDTRTTTLNLSLRQPLFNRAAAADIALARVALEAAHAEYEVVQQEFILKVAQTYFDVLSAQDVLAARQASKVSIASLLESAILNHEAGTAVITDRQDAQARYDLAVSEEITAENDLRVRRLALDRLSGRRGIVPNRLAQPLTLPPMPPGELDTWLQQAVQQPAVRRAQLALESARLDTRRAKASTLPTVDAVGSVGLNRVKTSGDAGSVDLSAGRSRNSSVGVELNIPLFAGFARQNRIAETLLLEERASESLEDARRTAAGDTERAYFDFQSGLARVKALEVAEASSQAALEGTQIGYRAGVRLNLDVLNAQTLLFQTRSNLARARYDVLMQSLKLRAAAGQLRPDSLFAINQLLAG